MKAVENHTLELLDFEIKDGRVCWSIRLGTGQIIEGRVRDQHTIPFYPNSWITLAIPIKVNVLPVGLAPDFMLQVPDVIVLDVEKSST